MTPPSHGDANSFPGRSESSQVDSAPSFLHIDTAALASSLSTLPMHLRLGLDRDFMELCEQEAPSGDADSSLLTSHHPLGNIDLSVCTTKHKKHTFEFKLPAGESSSSSSSFPSLKAPSSGGPSSRMQTAGESKDIGSSFERDAAPMSMPSHVKQDERISPDDGDEELDKLLQGSASLSLGGTTHESTGLAAVVASPPAGLQAQTEVHAQLNTDELDDMLDELLS